MNEMLTISSAEFASKTGFYTDEAMLQPVGVKRHGVTRVVLLSLKEYERLIRRDRQALHVRDLDEETIEAIRTAKPSKRAKDLDHLMEDARAR